MEGFYRDVPNDTVVQIIQTLNEANEWEWTVFTSDGEGTYIDAEELAFHIDHDTFEPIEDPAILNALAWGVAHGRN
jgi:hypothetical protein